MAKSVKSIIEGLKPKVPTHLSVVLEKAAVEAVDSLPEDATVNLQSSDLPGTTPGTVTLPALRYMIS